MLGGGSRHFEKGRLRTLSSTIESRKFERQEDTATEASTSGVLYPIANNRLVIDVCIYTRRGLMRCLSLTEAMREPDSGISEYRIPRLFILNRL